MTRGTRATEDSRAPSSAIIRHRASPPAKRDMEQLMALEIGQLKTLWPNGPIDSPLWLLIGPFCRFWARELEERL